MGATGAPKQALGGTAIKPVGWDRTGWEAFKYLIYDPSTGAILTRTPMSWFQITLFYIIYYSCLAGFWIACLQIFFLTLPETAPRWTLEKSLIGTNPGVGIRPRNSDLHIDSSIIALDAKASDTTATDPKGEGEKNADWARRMELYLDHYKNTTGLSECSTGDEKNHGKCLFNQQDLGDCMNYPYGFLLSGGDKYIRPCIFLKFNKIWDWKPKPIDPATLDDPKYDEMSPALKEKIRVADDPNYVWVDCRGRNPADREALSVNYFPENQGIHIKYFPFTGGNYHAPLVAMKMETERVSDLQIGQLIHVECRSWFDGVVHDTKEMSGLVRFELMLKQAPKL